jgi:hypothetical protein
MKEETDVETKMYTLIQVKGKGKAVSQYTYGCAGGEEV